MNYNFLYSRKIKLLNRKTLKKSKKKAKRMNRYQKNSNNMAKFNTSTPIMKNNKKKNKIKLKKITLLTMIMMNSKKKSTRETEFGKDFISKPKNHYFFLQKNYLIILILKNFKQTPSIIFNHLNFFIYYNYQNKKKLKNEIFLVGTIKKNNRNNFYFFIIFRNLFFLFLNKFIITPLIRF